MSEFKIGHGAICIKNMILHSVHRVGDVLLVDEITNCGNLSFEKINGYYTPRQFVPCTNPPRAHYKKRIAYALGADIEFGLQNGLWDKVSKPTFLKSHDYRIVIPDIYAEKRASLKAEIKRLQNELDGLGGDL